MRGLESVSLLFPLEYPIKPPIPYLRADFDRSYPHLQPDPADRLPQPCLVDGDLGELLHHRGLAGILDQLVEWLNRAAMGCLIDPEQGWEPVRRDDVADFIIANADDLRSWVDRRGGFIFLPLRYRALPSLEKDQQEGSGASRCLAIVGQQRLTLKPDELPRWVCRITSAEGHPSGTSVAILVWPGKGPSGAPLIADRYLPETVSELQGLIARAGEYGCERELRDALGRLRECGAAWDSKGVSHPIAVILFARCPFHLIGSDSPLEFCPYLPEIQLPLGPVRGSSTVVVRPMWHLHAVSRGLLARLSGRQLAPVASPWALIGCGSLGSKIALHLARAGDAPQVLIDHDLLSPHNAARHALLPLTPSEQAFWLGYKAEALAEAINHLGQSATGHILDARTLLRDARQLKQVLPKRAWTLVNATASLAVREALSVLPGTARPRVIETALFALGKIGMLAVEGAEGNPNLGDLVSELYYLAGRQTRIPEILEEHSIRRQEIGQGCGSATMVMTDARVSLHAAGMAEAIGTLRQRGFPEKGGLLWISCVIDDGLGLTWERWSLPPSQLLICENQKSWQVRISDRAYQLIRENVTHYPKVETGGILIGRLSEVAQTFYVTEVLPAPPDSKRSAVEFILGSGSPVSVGATYSYP